MDTSSPTDVLDPRGWLKIVPTLHRFSSEPRVREAIELGDAKKLHAALRACKKNPSFLQDAPVIDEILSIRRLFVYGSGAPSLFTLNGFGTKIYGKSDEGSDGTYVTTLFFTALFIPLIPIKQYLVRHEGDNRYAFFGSVPVSLAIRIWQLVVLSIFVVPCFGGMVASAVSGGGGSSYSKSGKGSFGSEWSSRTVWLLNGLDVPLKVSVEKDGKKESWKINAQSQTSAALPVGNHELIISSEDGVEISRDKVNITDGYKFAAYNLFASAPMYAQGAIYTSKTYVAGKDTEKEQYNRYSGQKWIEIADVSYPFSDPPKTMTFSKYETKRTLWYTGVEKGGWITTIFLLEKDKKSAEAEALAEAVMLAAPEDETAQKLARFYVRKYKGVDGAADLGAKMIDMWPNSLQAHRFYQDYAQLAGKQSELTTRYRELYTQDQSAWMGYLLARVETNDKALPLYEELVQKFPKDAYVHRGYGWLLLNSGKYEDAVTEFEQVLLLDPERHAESLSHHVKALAASGRAEEAAKLVEASENPKERPSLSNAILYGQLAKLAPGKTAHEGDYFMNKLVQDDKRGDKVAEQVVYDLLVDGRQPSNDDIDGIDSQDERDAVEITSIALKNPKGALKVVKQVPVTALERLDTTVLTLLALESTRLGDTEAADSLFKAVPELSRHRAEMAAFVKSGKVSPELKDIDLEQQAAMKLVRARGLPRKDKKRASLLSEAKSQDVLRGFVSHAAVAWAD